MMLTRVRGELLPIRDVRQEAAAALSRSVRRVCCAVGCDNRTSHAKPYCLEHLALMPYVRELLLPEARRARSA